jgi:hypothetical protein
MTTRIAFASFVLGLFASAAAAQPAHPGAYDPQTEQTYGGVIKGVVSVAGADGTIGVHVDLKTAAGTVIKVHLGPAVFIGMNNFSFFADDLVLVKGAAVNHGGETAVWAREVSRNGKTLTLRGPDGTPRWPMATAEDPDGCGVAHGPVR